MYYYIQALNFASLAPSVPLYSNLFGICNYCDTALRVSQRRLDEH